MILLDTHVLLWWSGDQRALSSVAASAIRRAPKLLVSPVSLYEVGRLAAKERIRLDRSVLEWTRDLIQEDDVTLAPLTATAAALASDLGESFPADPLDRLLYATAVDAGVPFVTKDRAIRTYAAQARNARIIW